METFGEWLQSQRTERKLTREEFATRVGCSVSLLRKIESGERRPSAQIAELMANCLDIPPEEHSTFVRVARGELNVNRMRLEPPSSSIAVNSHPESNLPIFPAPLIGRERELEQLSQILRDPRCRLITLVGLGGIGKTRFAIEAAARLGNDFRDGVYFVSLGPVDSTHYLVPVFADSIGFPFQGTNPTDPKTQLFNYLKGKQILLLVDNLEHLLNEPGIVELLTGLMQQAPRVKLLATSREPLNIQGEWIIEVLGLPVPKNHDLEGTSVELFLQRARRANVYLTESETDFPAILRICELMNGMPLGIELAAAWVRTLSCVEIAEEIERGLDFLSVSSRDLPARHRSLRAVFDHSWKLLSDEERSVLARLSVFQGGFSREAAEQIAGATLSTLSDLVAKSLIHRTGKGRYNLHELVRRFASDRLHEDTVEEDMAGDHHGRYYLAFLQQREAILTGERQEAALAELNAEFDNLRTAWDRAAALHQIPQLRQTVWSWWYYYSLRGLFQEGEATLLRAVESARTMDAADPVDVAARKLALAHLQVFTIFFALRQGHVVEAHHELQQILEILRKHNEQGALVDALFVEGTALLFLGQFRESSLVLRESYSLGCVLDRRWETATCASWIGKAEFESGNYDEAQRWLAEGLALSEALGNPVNISFVISSLSQAMYALGRAAEMEPILRTRLQLAEGKGFQLTTGLLKEQLAQADYAIGNLEEARLLCQEIVAMYRELGDFWNLSRALNQMGRLELGGGAEPRAEASFTEALAIASKGHLIANAMDALIGIATVRARGGKKASALVIVIHILQHPSAMREVRGRAETLRTALAGQLSPTGMETIQAQAGKKTFEAIVEDLLK